MKKNKKDNKVKLNATDVALICGMLHLDCGKMIKYEKKILKNNPSLRETIDLIGKDTKTYLAVMIGYHISKIEKINKKKKKAIAKSRKSNKKNQAKDEAYWQTKTNRNFDCNTDSLFDSELPPLGTLPIDNKADDKSVGEAVSSEPIRRVSPIYFTGAARVISVYESEPGIRVAGCMVCSGMLKVNTKAQVIRNDRIICEGTITKLKRFKNEVDEVNRGFETGVVIDNCGDIRHNDFVVCFDVPDADSTVNTDNSKADAANDVKPQDKQLDDDPVDKDASSEIIYRADPEDLIGKATVSDVICIGRRTVVADCMVYDGKLKVHTKAQVIRDGRVVYEGTIVKLNNHDDYVNEVCSGRKAAVAIGDFSDYKINDIIDCFEDKAEDEDSAANTDNDNTTLQPVDETTPTQYTVPKFIDGGRYKILITNVDTENNTYTYLDLGEYHDTTPAMAPTILSSLGAICEEDCCKLAEKFGIEPNRVSYGTDAISVDLPTKSQLDVLKSMYNDLNLNDSTLEKYLFEKPLLVYDAFGIDRHKSRTALMPNGELTKRQCNWHAVVIPSVTIEF